MHVLHLLPADGTRGAQRYARALADGANLVPGQHHVVAVVFDSPTVAARADVRLGVRSGRLHRAGLDPVAVRRVRRLVQDLRPDVVVAHGGEAQTYAAFLPPRQPLICLAIGVSPRRATTGWRRQVLRWTYARADLVGAVSDAVAEHVRDCFDVPGDRIRVMINARDPAVFRPSGATSRVPRVVFVGHLTATKRPELFVDVVHAVRAQGIAVEAVMAGDGPLLDQVSTRAGGEVELLGACDDVPALLAGCAVLCFTSASEGEGMPGVLIEAAMSGLSVVATDVPGVREVVRDGLTGIVVPEDDEGAFARAVGDLLLDPTRRTAMGAAARADAVERFSLRASVQEWLEALDGVRSRRSGNRGVK